MDYPCINCSDGDFYSGCQCSKLQNYLDEVKQLLKKHNNVANNHHLEIPCVLSRVDGRGNNIYQLVYFDKYGFITTAIFSEDEKEKMESILMELKGE